MERSEDIMNQNINKDDKLCASLTNTQVYVKYGDSNITELFKSMILRNIESGPGVENAKS
jgi:hypothetical protein